MGTQKRHKELNKLFQCCMDHSAGIKFNSICRTVSFFLSIKLISERCKKRGKSG